MWILLLPLILAEAIFWLGMLFFAIRAFKAIRIGNLVGAALWVTLLMVPVIFYQYKHYEADQKEAARVEVLASLPKISLAANHPRLLEVHGVQTEFELLIILSTLNIDEVIQFQRPHKGRLYGQFITLVPGCENIGKKHLETWKNRGRFSSPTKRDKECLIGEWKTVSADRIDIPAIEYRMGPQSALKQKGTGWGDGNYEVWLRTAEGPKLVKHWERPYVTRPSWLGPWGYAFPANTDSKKYKRPKRLDFLLDAFERA